MSLDHRLSPETAPFTETADTLEIIAESTRLQLLIVFTDAERNVTDLVDLIGASRTVISQLLARIRLGGLVDDRRDGRNVFYRAADSHVIRLVAGTLSCANCIRSGEPIHD